MINGCIVVLNLRIEIIVWCEIILISELKYLFMIVSDNEVLGFLIVVNGVLSIKLEIGDMEFWICKFI